MWFAVAIGMIVILGLTRLAMRPRMRDARLDRDWAGAPGKYDNPARRPRG